MPRLPRFSRALLGVLVTGLFAAACGSSPARTETVGPPPHPHDGFEWMPEHKGVSDPAVSKNGLLAARLHAFPEVGNDRIAIIDQRGIRAITPASDDPVEYVWMPDGLQLLVSEAGTDLDSPNTLALFSIQGRRLKTIHPHPALQTGWGMAVSPDGRELVAAASTPGLGNPADLYLINLDTGAARRLTRSPSDSSYGSPQWPVRDRILFGESRSVTAVPMSSMNSTSNRVRFVVSLIPRTRSARSC